MRINTVMTHRFSEVPQANIPRSQFDRSCGRKTTFDAGYLVPIFVDDALPGDTFSLRMTSFTRMSTPLFPIMDNMYMDTFFFAVPYRLVWDNWQKFNGEQDNPGDSTDFVIPQIVSPDGGFLIGSIYDQMGIVPFIGGLSFGALEFRAYNLIYNEWFRDQNLQNSVSVPTDDGPDSDTLYQLLRRGKRHDYFTSCLPFPQKGPAVTLPLGTTAPLVATGPLELIDNLTATTRAVVTNSAVGNVLTMNGTDVGTAGVNLAYAAGMEVNLSAATAATVNQLREAFQIQKLYERDARGGTRYTEILRAHFGVVSPDARLQRPEYLGGGSSPININPIAQTSATTGQPTPQGNLAAIGTCSINGHGFTKSFVEHTIIIGLVSVRADLNYQQGMERRWFRSTRFDFFWPALSHIGEQAVLNQEIYTQGVPTDQDVFGYQERFAEYRYKPSLITGQFRSNALEPLDAWHLAQNFLTLPVLNSEFIVENPPVDRILAVSGSDQFLFDAIFNLKCARPMSVYSVPGLIDHF